MRRLVTLAVVVVSALMSSSARAETLEWIRQLGSSGYDSSRAVSADGHGSVYISGSTDGSLGGPNAGDIDTLLAKYDASGTLEWTQQLGTSSDDVSGLANLTWLSLSGNQISSVESGAFSGLTNLTVLDLQSNGALTELNLAEADLSKLHTFNVRGNVNINSVSLKNTVLTQRALDSLLDGGHGFMVRPIGIGERDGITEMDLSGIDFAEITDLAPLYVMDDLTDLWQVDTQNLDATDLDVLLDNLETIEGTDTEGTLYMTQANYDAFNTAGGGLLAA